MMLKIVEIDFQKTAFGLIILLVLGFSCKPTDQSKPAASGNYQHGVWIINEGGYGYGNAGVSFYHKDKDTLEKDVFATINNHPLGDVLQNMVHWDGKYFLVLNSSYDMVVVDDQHFKVLNVIHNLTLPRYFLPISNQKAYLTNETAREITIIDPTNLVVTGHITYNPGPDSLGSWTEQMLYYQNNLYVTCVKSGKIIVINTLTDKITDTIKLSIGAKNLVLDKNNKIWALCDGTIAIPFIASKLYCIDPVSKSVLQQYTFPNIQTGVGNLTVNYTEDSLFYVYGGIYKMGIAQGSLPSKYLINGAGHSFYGLGLDPDNQTIYAGDELGFGQPGLVFQYNSSGRLLKTHKSGIGPNGFLFVK